MEKNRWNDALVQYHDQIYSLGSPYGVFWEMAAHEIIHARKDSGRILELGCGDGRSTLPLIEKMDAKFDLVDLHNTMLNKASSRLNSYRHRTQFIEADAEKFLRSQEKIYDVIYSSHLIHNLSRVEKVYLLSAIHGCLQYDGMFVLVDQISRKGYDDKEYFARQMKRYAHLPAEASRAIRKHMQLDLSENYVMSQSWLRRKLRSIGFRDVRFVDYIERETLVITTK